MNKIFVGILNLWIALPIKDMKLNAQQIQMISSVWICTCEYHCVIAGCPGDQLHDAQHRQALRSQGGPYRPSRQEWTVGGHCFSHLNIQVLGMLLLLSLS